MNYRNPTTVIRDSEGKIHYRTQYEKVKCCGNCDNSYSVANVYGAERVCNLRDDYIFGLPQGKFGVCTEHTFRS